MDYFVTNCSYKYKLCIGAKQFRPTLKKIMRRKCFFMKLLTLSPMVRGAVHHSLWFFALYSKIIQATHT